MITVLRDAWRLSPLAWIHRAEARSMAAELAASGRAARLVTYDAAAMPESASPPLLRLSDPVMSQAVRTLQRPYIGPGAAVMARCYDKYEACRRVRDGGIDVPRTALGSEGRPFAAPFIVKPRQGSDSIGLALVRGALPDYARTDAYLVQEHVAGAELTVAVLRAHVGQPVRIVLPEGMPYSFARKYFLPAKRIPVADQAVIDQVRDTADRIAALLGIDWAARIDFIREASGRLSFLECDVAPLVGAQSAFALSLAAAGIERPRQLELLLNEHA